MRHFVGLLLLYLNLYSPPNRHGQLLQAQLTLSGPTTKKRDKSKNRFCRVSAGREGFDLDFEGSGMCGNGKKEMAFAKAEKNMIDVTKS